MVQRNAKKVWSMSSNGAIQGQALIEALSNDNEVTRYLSHSELLELTNVDYYVKYIDTTFARLEL
jgi:adenylosuccinate lyase